MGLIKRFQKQKSYLGLDISSGYLKLLELDLSEEVPRLVNIAVVPLKSEAFNNNIIVNPEILSEQIANLLEANEIQDKEIVACVPATSVFTKRIKVPDLDDNELRSHINFEAANFIPHNVSNVKLDYHVSGRSGKNNLDCLVVAVKNEVVDSLVGVIESSGLKVGIVDVDFLAVQNMFETNYPDLVSSNVALINIGSKFSSLNICKNGESLLNGDVSVGSKSIVEAIGQATGLSGDDVEKGKSSISENHKAKEALDGAIENLASEYNRQLNFLWSNAQSDEGIDAIVICGNCMGISDLSKELSEKTGIPCHIANPLKNIAIGEGFDEEYVKSLSNHMSACVGLAIRHAGDRNNFAE